jgi:hypothetical protein
MDADRAENKQIVKRFGIKGFPGLKVFVDGKLHADYGRGGRTAAHIVSYLRRLRTPAVVALAGGEVEAFLAGGNGDTPVYVLVGGRAHARDAFAAAAAAAGKHTWFGHVHVAQGEEETAVPSEVLASLGLRAASLPALVAVHTPTSPSSSSGAEVFSGAMEAAAMTAFVDATRLPVVVGLDQAVFPVVANSLRPAVLLLVSGGSAKGAAAATKAMTATAITMTEEEQDAARCFLNVAKRHRAAAQFATVDMALLGPWVKAEMSIEPGVGGVRLPAVVVYHKVVYPESSTSKPKP